MYRFGHLDEADLSQSPLQPVASIDRSGTANCSEDEEACLVQLPIDMSKESAMPTIK